MTTAAEPALLVERDGHVLTLTINRPAKRNAFNAEVLCRLSDAWKLLDADPELRVAILTGADGDFSAGADLDRLVGAMISGKPAENEFEERVRQDFSLIFKGFLKDHHVTKPLVAAVEGYCYAGGMEILQACDIRVAAEDAQLALSEVLIAANAFTSVPRVVTRRRRRFTVGGKDGTVGRASCAAIDSPGGLGSPQVVRDAITAG